MRHRITIGLVTMGLLIGSFAVANYAAETKSSRPKWEYTVIRHGPLLKSGGSDLKEFQKMGAEGWELAASYPTRGEVVTAIFKRPK